MQQDLLSCSWFFDLVLYTYIHTHVCYMVLTCLIKCKLSDKLNSVSSKLPNAWKSFCKLNLFELHNWTFSSYTSSHSNHYMFPWILPKCNCHSTKWGWWCCEMAVYIMWQWCHHNSMVVDYASLELTQRRMLLPHTFLCVTSNPV